MTSLAQQAQDLASRPLLGDMLSDKELNQILHTVGYESTTGLLLLSRRIFALYSSGEYLERCYASLMQGNATIGADRVFAHTSFLLHRRDRAG